MSATKSGQKRGPGGRPYPEPEPRLGLPEPNSECSTPELASGLAEGLKAALRRLGGKRKAGADDDTPEAT